MIGEDFARAIFDFCLPRECPSCRRGYEARTAFCADCESELIQLEALARCDKCSMPAAFSGAPCAQCLDRGLSPFKKIASLGVLKDPLQSAIHRAKYQHRWALAEKLADRLYKRGDVRRMLRDAEAVVPVPLHRQRQRQRGYNQAAVISRRLLSQCNYHGRPAIAAPVVRIVSTDTQTHLASRASRTENLRNAFVLVDDRPVAGKRIVLVDDVITTGATLLSLARTLRPAKPASISAIVLCVADPKGRQFEEI